MTSQVLGVQALLARFARTAIVAEAAVDVQKDVLADDVERTAESLAPVDTGRLRDSIRSEGGRVYTDVEYAGFVEYGTSDTPAQPFMRPAADTVDGAHAEQAARAMIERA